MGIKGINKVIERHSPDAFISISLKEFDGKRIAVDANNLMYTLMATARKKVINMMDIALQEPNIAEIRREWFLLTINFIINWLSYNITPIFVFDGIHPPEKNKTKAERKSKRVASRAKIDALYDQLKANILEQPAGIVEELRTELRNYVYIPPEDFELFKTIIKGIGVPCLQATADGEQLCSMLCIEGKVAAVFSVDTDNLAYGCPLVINKTSDTHSYDENGFRINHVQCVRLDKVLNGLEMSHSVFVDLCIMSGCDFNTNMPNYAAFNSYKLLKKYGSIDDLPRHLDISCLNHDRCRQLFRYQSLNDLIVKDDSSEQSDKAYDPDDSTYLNINKNAMITARDYLDIVGISGQIDRILTAYHHLKYPEDGSIINLQLGNIPKYFPPPKRIMLKLIGGGNEFKSLLPPIRSLPEPSIITIPLPNKPQPIAISIPKTQYLTLKIIK